MLAGEHDHRIDDQLADIEHGDRNEGAHQPQADAGRGEQPARAPDLADEARQMAEGADADVEPLDHSGLAMKGRRCEVMAFSRTIPSGPKRCGPLAGFLRWFPPDRRRISGTGPLRVKTAGKGRAAV